MEQTTNSAASLLLPPFDPLPSLATSLRAPSPAPQPEFSPLPSRSASPTPFPTPTASTPASPHPSPSVFQPQSASSAFFARLRSNSLHNNVHPSSSSTSRRQRECSPPPVPSITTTPRNSRIVSNSSCKLSPPSSRNAPESIPPSPSTAIPFIKSVTVPHHSKSGKNWLFACRVVPVSTSSEEAKGKARVYGLGKMELANDNEPYTVYRSWSECVEFSSRLVQLFPDDRQTAYESISDRFNHQVPRLSRKLVLFMTRSTLEQRQAELDLFCRRLFQMSVEVRDSLVVRSFFGLKSLGGGGTNAQLDFPIPANIPIPPIPSTDFERHYEDKNATIKPVKPKPRRPALAIKISTPNLRSAAKSVDPGMDSLSPESTRPSAVQRAFTVDETDFRAPSEISVASSATVTPSLYAAQNTAAVDSPTQMTQDGRFKTLRKKASGPLRHFRSLQDLRGSSNAALEVPDEPLPSLRLGLVAPSMMRFASQPHPRPTPAPLQFGAPIRLASGPACAPVRPPHQHHRRTTSSTSSISSTDGDLWGTSCFVPAPTAFRQTPTGRLESVPLQQSQRSYSSSSYRRHGGGNGERGGGSSISTQKASLGHSSSASISSLDSIRSSTSIRSYEEESGSGSRSTRNSFDWGSVAGDGFCPTPPTPQSPWAQKDGSFTPQLNMVPPPPFFPVPPSMTSPYSHDGGFPHTSRIGLAHKSSLEQSTSSQRSRTDSTASRRFDCLTASPSAGSTSTAASSPVIGGLDSRPKWTFKLLHSHENVVLRIAKEDLSLERLRIDTRAKFTAAGVDLPDEEAHWGLSYTVKAGEAGSPDECLSTSKLIVTQRDLDECLATATGKVTFKVVS
ncbi:uncharacterized protein JCM6883_003389 [Sporobolomyces salmoneus]|uniref:uncharacterized protein n=1 Tax=Sporobolomyces salmoneus TaxID=183962 RepID=UPI00317FF38B